MVLISMFLQMTRKIKGILFGEVPVVQVSCLFFLQLSVFFIVVL